MIEQIEYAILEFEFKSIKREDLLIAYSPLVKRYILEEILALRIGYPFDGEPKKINGVDVFDKWPNNEIVIYCPEKTCLYPDLITIIKIDRNDAIKEGTPGV